MRVQSEHDYGGSVSQSRVMEGVCRHSTMMEGVDSGRRVM